MKQYLTDFFEAFGYPDEGRAVLSAAYEKIQDTPSSKARFSSLMAEYDKSYDIDYEKALAEMAEISEGAAIHRYTGDLLLFICYSRRLEGYYREAGIDREIFVRSMYDLKYKLTECKLVRNVYGTFVPSWFARFFKLTRFAFHKLQFEIVKLGANYEGNGVTLTPESEVINVHIPRTGERLDRESMLLSYSKAAEFFADRLKSPLPIVFHCHSWLLFPKHREIMKPSSNLYAFMSDYNIISSGYYDSYNDIWRLFDTLYTADHSKLPSDTSLRREYIKLMDSGEKTGWGKGVFVYKTK